MQKAYYLDSCIWLNLFKKEAMYWIIAKNFLKQNNKIFISTIVLKELSFKIKHFDQIQKIFKDISFIQIIKTTKEDYELARKFEKYDNFNISFYDYLHIAISKRLNIPLITRDKELMKFARKYIEVYKPEDLIC